MTRNEAIKLVKDNFKGDCDADSMIKTFELLGLIKFDPEPIPFPTIAYDEIIKKARDYMDIVQTPTAGAKASVIIDGLLKIIDNKYDDIKTVKIGKETKIILDKGIVGELITVGLLKQIKQ